MEFESLLNHINKKVSLTAEEEKIVISRTTLRTYLKGQYIVQCDDILRFQNFIISGKVNTFYLDETGDTHIVAFGIKDWWVGDICSFTNRTPAEFSSQCIAKTTLAQINYDDMQKLYSEVPKLERYFRLILEAAYANMSKRIIRNHSMSAKNRYLLFIESYPEIAQSVPQYMIASYLGITKEFLSTIRNQLSTK